MYPYHQNLERRGAGLLHFFKLPLYYAPRTKHSLAGAMPLGHGENPVTKIQAIVVNVAQCRRNGIG